MLILKLGAAIRTARCERGLTQAQLAAASGLSRNTINRLENGLFPDLGIRKAQALLQELGMELVVQAAKTNPRTINFVDMACTSASVSFKTQLTPQELVRALLSGKPTPGKEAHFIVLLEESPGSVLTGLVQQAGAWVRPEKIRKNLERIASQVGVRGRTWQRKIA